MTVKDILSAIEESKRCSPMIIDQLRSVGKDAIDIGVYFKAAIHKDDLTEFIEKHDFNIEGS